jgi:hypothetical protein
VTTKQKYIEPTNATRAADFAIAFRAYIKTQEPRSGGELERLLGQTCQDYLVDLLADLRHWANQNGVALNVDFSDADRLAGDHFRAELEEEHNLAIDYDGKKGGAS